MTRSAVAPLGLAILAASCWAVPARGAPDDLRLVAGLPLAGTLVDRGGGFDVGVSGELRLWRMLGLHVEGRRSTLWWKPSREGLPAEAQVRGAWAGLAALRLVLGEPEVSRSVFLAPLLEGGILAERWASHGHGSGALAPGDQLSLSLGAGTEIGFVTPLDLRVPLVVRAGLAFGDDAGATGGDRASGHLERRWSVMTGVVLHFLLLSDPRVE